MADSSKVNQHEPNLKFTGAIFANIYGKMYKDCNEYCNNQILRNRLDPFYKDNCVKECMEFHKILRAENFEYEHDRNTIVAKGGCGRC